MSPERIHRVMMAAMIGVCLALLASGMQTIAMGVMSFMIVMLLVWAFFDFCPALKILGKFTGCNSSKSCCS